jgi:hypothetical protein
LEGEALIVLTDRWDEVRLPRSLVRGIVFAQRNHPADRQRLEDAVRRHGSAEGGTSSSDAVLLTNNDRAAGQLTGLSGGALELTTVAGEVKLPLSRVEAVEFADRRQAPAARHPPTVVVGTSDGTVLMAKRLVADEKSLSLELASGLQLAGGSAADVVFVQSLGAGFTYLSDLEPASYRHVPYLSTEWPMGRDRNLHGDPLMVNGRRYWKGISMHSASRATYRLDGRYRRFDAMVAVDDSAGKKGSVTFGAYVEREGQWTAAFTSGILRGGDPPQPVSVDLDGAQGLTLTVDFADRGDELDHADWLDPRLVR